MNNITKLSLKFTSINELRLILGNTDRNLKALCQVLDVEIYTKGEDIFVNTTNMELIKLIEKVLLVLKQLVVHNIVFLERDIIYITNLCKSDLEEEIVTLYLDRKEIVKSFTGVPIFPKTIMQTKYVKAINNNDLVFGIGPAGTGKTYLAVINAIAKLKSNEIKKIILTRPAVEAGESLGFLPGDLKEKVDPYLRPLYDALYEVLGTKQTEELIEKGVIEIAPLAYMRGRTLDNAYVILDEAQNTTENQMKLFLTRLGFNSKMIVTGDITQIDLPKNKNSGLIQATKILSNIKGIEIIEFKRLDVVRHPLVQKVLYAYESKL